LRRLWVVQENIFLGDHPGSIGAGCVGREAAAAFDQGLRQRPNGHELQIVFGSSPHNIERKMTAKRAYFCPPDAGHLCAGPALRYFAA
jgi:hypothetical protein